MSCKCKECKCEKNQTESNPDNSTIIPDEIISETPNDAELGGVVREFYIKKWGTNITTINSHVR